MCVVGIDGVGAAGGGDRGWLMVVAIAVFQVWHNGDGGALVGSCDDESGRMVVHRPAMEVPWTGPATSPRALEEQQPRSSHCRPYLSFAEAGPRRFHLQRCMHGRVSAHLLVPVLNMYHECVATRFDV